MHSKSFFKQNTLSVAKKLLGKSILRRYRGKVIKGIIVETEAYMGFDDKASHASRGKTTRNEIMFDASGKIYVYLIYGMHYCLNIVTERKDYPSAVLIRGVTTLGNTPILLNGPGKFTKYFHIDKSFNKKRLGRKTGLWIEKGKNIKKWEIKTGHRVGVHYAGVWAKKPWRFYMI